MARDDQSAGPMARIWYSRSNRGADEERSSTRIAMNQQAPEAQVDVFRTILDLENRGQQIEEIVQRIKEVFLISRGGVSLPDAVGVLDELHWSSTHLANGVRALENHLGIRRKPVSSSPAESAPKANHSLRGSTRSIPMPDLIALLSAQRKTGTLYIKCQDERFVLELLEGEVVHVVSDSPRNKQRLGDILVAQQKISTEELEEFLQDYCRKDGRLGEALARTKIVSEGDLRDALEYQVRELFRRVFALEDALFSFQAGKMSDLQHRVSLNTTQLLLETARLEDEQRREAADDPFPSGLDTLDLEPAAQFGEGPGDASMASEDPITDEAASETGEDTTDASANIADDATERDGETPAADVSSEADDAPAASSDEQPDAANADAEGVRAEDAPTNADPTDETLESPALDAPHDSSDSDDEAQEFAADEDDQAEDRATVDAESDANADEVTASEDSDGATSTDDDPATDDSTDAATSDQEAIKALQVVSGITRRTAKQLVRRGIRDVEGVRRASDRDLLAVPGIGHRTLRLIRQYCERADSE